MLAVMCAPSTPDIAESSPGRSCLCAFLLRSLVGHSWRQLSQKIFVPLLLQVTAYRLGQTMEI
jgi:hypothetical protein